MSYEWPLLGSGAEAGERMPSPSPRFYEAVAQVTASPAIDAFARRRAGQIVNKGRTLESDLTRPPGTLARHAKGSLSTFLDIIGPMRMNMPPHRRTECLKAVEAAGAALIALYERLQIEVPEE